MGNDISVIEQMDKRLMDEGYSLPDIILYQDGGLSSLQLYPFFDYKGRDLVSYEELKRAIYRNIPWSTKDESQIIANTQYLLSILSRNRNLEGVISYEENGTGYRIFFQSVDEYIIY